MKIVEKYNGSGDLVHAYQDADIEKMHGVIQQARALWKKKTREYVEKHGDVGTCVLGAGIQIWYLPSRCRRPRLHTIVSSPGVAQGSVCWEYSKDEVMEFMRSAGFKDLSYAWGRMD